MIKLKMSISEELKIGDAVSIDENGMLKKAEWGEVIIMYIPPTAVFDYDNGTLEFPSFIRSCWEQYT